MNKSVKKNNKGFTLVELIVVIAVISIISIVIAPRLIEYVEKARKGTDENAIWEVAHAAEVAYVAYGKEEGINEFTLRIGPEGNVSYAPASTFVNKVSETVSREAYVYKSKTYRGTTHTITVDTLTGKASVNGDEHIDIAGTLDKLPGSLNPFSDKTAKDTIEELIQQFTGGKKVVVSYLPYKTEIQGGYQMKDSDWEAINELVFEGKYTVEEMGEQALKGNKQYFENLLKDAEVDTNNK